MKILTSTLIVLSLVLNSACSFSRPSKETELLVEEAVNEESKSAIVNTEEQVTEPEPEPEPEVGTEVSTFTFEEIACGNDLTCFIDGVNRNWTTYYDDEVWVEPLPGVSYSSYETWAFDPNPEGGYIFDVTSANETPPSFEEGWFEAYARSAAAPAEIKSMILELDAATFPTEEELAQFDEETRATYELQMNSGKTASEVAWMSAAYLMESQLYGTIMGVRSTRYDCSSKDTSSLIEILQNFDTNTVLLPDEYPFLTCHKSYQF